MRKLPWGVISVVVAVGALNLFFAGCGSDETPVTDPDSGASSSGTASSSGISSSSGTSGTSSSGGTTDGGAQDGDIQDGQGCALVGQNCTAATAGVCCSKLCNVAAGQTQGQCAVSTDGGFQCTAPAGACTSGTQCCTGSCVAGFCSATACKQDSPTAETCTANEQCCSGKCGASGTGTCVALGGGSTCRTEGNACTQNSNCCSGQCGANGRCVNVSFCSQENDVCASDFECCGGTCIKQGADTLGRCGLIGISGGNCKPTGSVCSGIGCDNTCCSLSCGPYGATGVNICQPPSGCKPQFELCAKGSDCCGGEGQLTGQASNGSANEPIECVVPGGETLGRCEGEQCLRPGAVCKAVSGACGGTSNNCCESLLPDGGLTPTGFCNSTPEACCSRDALGIPRCRGVNFICADGGVVAPGSTCTTSADCCGKPCVGGKCQGTCVPKSGECTVTADCCSPEQCVFAAGSVKGICGGVVQTDGGVTAPTDSGTPPADAGICALYGQTCTVSGDCCNGVPCTGGICRFN